ncbi:MAG: hypothetical protein QOC92_2299 [Acidimicrobiaceae bacterium]
MRTECCFCSVSVEADAPGALTLVVAAVARSNEVDRPTQQLWCHAACLGERLTPSVPFDPLAFDE